MEEQFIKTFKITLNNSLADIEQIMLDGDTGSYCERLCKGIEGYSIDEKALNVYNHLRS